MFSYLHTFFDPFALNFTLREAEATGRMNQVAQESRDLLPQPQSQRHYHHSAHLYFDVFKSHFSLLLYDRSKTQSEVQRQAALFK